MTSDFRCFTRPAAMTAVCVFIYFVVFPDDVRHVTAPIVNFLDVSNSVSPWLYAVCAVAIISSAVTKALGVRRDAQH